MARRGARVTLEGESREGAGEEMKGNKTGATRLDTFGVTAHEYQPRLIKQANVIDVPILRLDACVLTPRCQLPDLQVSGEPGWSWNGVEAGLMHEANTLTMRRSADMT